MPAHPPRRDGLLAGFPPITDFESYRRLRPLLLHRCGDILGVWRFCGNGGCRRRRSCGRGDAACFTVFMQALPEEDRRLFRYAIEFRRDGLEAGEAIERARALVRDEIARFGE